MVPHRFGIDAWVIAFVVIATACEWRAYGQAATPMLAPRATNAAIALTTSQINSSDSDSIPQGEKQIKLWISKGIVPTNLWRTWLPMLMMYQRYQDVADLSQLAVVERPTTDVVSTLLVFRVKALIAMHKTAEALAAAKSFFNACALKDTGNALDLIEQCFGGTQSAIQFRAEQQLASSTDASSSEAPVDASFVKSISIDPQPYDKAVASWSRKDRASYANVLLVAGRCAEAEAVFRDLFQNATSQAQLTVAIEGIARSLRAEDGNVKRADAWILALQGSTESSTTQQAK